MVVIMRRAAEAIAAAFRAPVREQRQVEIGQPTASLLDRLPSQWSPRFVKVDPRKGHTVLARCALHDRPRVSLRLQVQVGVQDRVPPEVRSPRILDRVATQENF